MTKAALVLGIVAVALSTIAIAIVTASLFLRKVSYFTV
jgi:hypothetical protein